MTEADLERYEASKFDITKPLVTMEDVRLRLQKGYVVYQWQFQAFLDAYDSMRRHLEQLEKTRKYLGAWAMTHKPSFERYERQREDERRKKWQSMRAGYGT